MKDIKIIMIDDEESVLLDIKEYFDDYNVTTFSNPVEALNELKTNKYDIIVADFKMPQLSGLELLIEAKKCGAYDYGILLSAYIDKELLEEMVNKNLVTKIIEKPVKLKQLKITLDEAIAECTAKKVSETTLELVKSRYEDLKKELDLKYTIIGIDKGLKPIFEKVKSVAELDVTVLLTGETGTGKEVIAHAIHSMSNRSEGPFIKINCSAVPESLFESELFGYKKGAFTDAKMDKPGKFEMANGGTLFLDEIGEMKPDLQVKLLRVLQEREVVRLGDVTPIKVDFRLVCATNVTLKDSMGKKEFREDLYYRINDFPIHLPPLRDRKSDIDDLFNFFLRKSCEEMNLHQPDVDPKVYSKLKEYSWPGNIREFENAVRRIIISLRGSNTITGDCLNFLFPEISSTALNLDEIINILGSKIIQKELTLKNLEEQVVLAILNKFNGKVLDAVKETGIKKDKFYKYRNQPS